MRDDEGTEVPLPRRVRRVASLVPSLTEAIAVTDPGLLVGATAWCVHPPGLDVVRLRGTKNPDVAGIIGLRPDLVIANFEENRPADIAALREAGLAVWVTVIRTLPEALAALGRVLSACGIDGEPDWLTRCRTAWELPGPGPGSGSGPGPRWRAVIPIWRRPWMVLGGGTFAGDLLDRLGVRNLYADSADRYPRVTVDEMLARSPGLVVLPDEPYAFGESDGPEAFPGVRAACVSGRHLTWYGPSLAEAPAVLTAGISM